ncbi:MAG: sugar ABC transporter permease [Spirochaetaceae bacterium]|nr:MAG: sugar ABC transporter permease [Spirochaetaceae bacterium]
MAQFEAVVPPFGTTGTARKKRRIFTARSIPLYLMILPAMVLTIMFQYIPIPGRLIAFMDFRTTGFQGWVGFEHFRFLFNTAYFWNAFRNTWRFIFLGYLFVFPAPIIFALLLNEIKFKPFKKAVQTLTVLPHFINWVVVSTIFMGILSPRFGYVNDLIRALGGQPVFFLSLPDLFPWLLTFLRIWKGVGYSAIIYLAALSGVDAELYESAVIDGAGRIRQTLAVTLPALAPTILVLFVLSFSDVFAGLFEPVLMLKNPMINATAEILDTYIYEVGLERRRYGLGAAAGLFKAAISMSLLLTVNWVSKRFSSERRGIF